jgi:very-short-patch-repair endonuclease
MGKPSPEVAVMRTAARQLGLFTSAQAIEHEWCMRSVRHRVRTGEVRCAQPNVFAFAATPATWEQRLLAVTLAGGPGSAVSHESAAILYQCEDWIDRFHRPVHVAVPDDRQPSIVRASLHRPFLPSDHIGVVDGIPCTTFARTVIDLSGRASLGQVARALDHGLVRNLVTLRDIARCLVVLPGAPGRRPRLVRMLVAERTSANERAESRPEMRLVNALRSTTLPVPVPQHWVTVDGERFRIDAAYPEARLGLEYLGFDAHRTRSAFDRDFRRDRILSRIGWTILYFTSVCTDAEIAADVRVALDGLAAHPPGLLQTDR